ncbi:hypothetical protein PR202_ga04659 [Eleusine coracana subsp. coracana]|uniref:Uncharacterized protein n=1 Tax=Eleusine coracana subsp. coracana TaxID=191504 RepID=A0AAV5BQX6_ELECO|nr:hypothetical protein PR202_ga04659 [Eleusine coracana subsp. coracana]
MTIAMLSNAAAAVSEGRRRASPPPRLSTRQGDCSDSVFWLVPQYAIQRRGQRVSMTSGGWSFCTTRRPRACAARAARSTAHLAIGSYLGTLLVTIVHEKQRRSGSGCSDNLNRGSCHYYWLVVGMQMINQLGAPVLIGALT